MAESINRTLMNKVRATLEHSQLHQVHWEDALHDSVYKYSLTYHHGLQGIPYPAWHGEPTRVRRLFAFGQLAYTPILKPHRPKLASRAAPVRYLYGPDDTHVCVQHIVTRQYHKVRAIDLKPYHRQHDPSHNSNIVFTAQAKNRTRHRRKQTPTTVTTNTAPLKTLRQARKYPDAHKWAEAHDAELDQLDKIQAIDWKSQTTPEQRKEIIPTTMTYRYKRDKNPTKYKARCSIRGDRMTPHIHYDPDTTATYMADRTTVRTMFAIAASMNMKIEHFDITGAYLHEEYKHTKKYSSDNHRDSTDSTSTRPHTAN